MKTVKRFVPLILLAYSWFAISVLQAQSTSFSFTLDEPCKTSAGVYSLNGSLVRTLWSNQRYYASGSYTAEWDGLDDSSNAVPAGPYEIKLLQHNAEYVWVGAIDNTTAKLSGPTTGDYSSWLHDQSDDVPQHWRFVNARNIREQIGIGPVGGTITLSNQIYDFPSGVTGQNGNQSGQLSWHSVAGATSYNIRYSLTNGGPYSVLAGTTTNLSCIIGGLSNGVTYYFAVTAAQGQAEGTPSEQVPINPFDTTRNVLCAGSMAEDGQLAPIVEVSSIAASHGQPSYLGVEHRNGVLDLRELDYRGYGDLQNETVGTEGYALYDWQGAGTALMNLAGPFTLTLSSGWLDLGNLERQYRVDDSFWTFNHGMAANPQASVNIGVSDTNFHYLTVESPAQFNTPRAFSLRLISTNNTSAVYTLNENPGLSHVFQFLFRGDVTLTADAAGFGSTGAIVQGLFFDGAPVISSVSSASPVASVVPSATEMTSAENPASADSIATSAAAVSGNNGTPARSRLGLLNSASQTTLNTTELSANSSLLDASSSSATSTNGLIAWYPLAGNANDYSGNGNNGTPVGNPTYTTGVTGTANTAISLNGSSQYVSLGHPSLYNFATSNFTVSVWFNTTAGSLRQQLFSCDAISGRQFVFDINDFPGAPVASYLFSGNSTFFAEEGGSALAANTWYLATFVKSGNEPGAMTLYLNGSPVSSPIPFGVDFPLTMQATSSEVDIGHRIYNGYNDFFSGSLCGVRIYNRALAPTEIGTLYSNDLAGVSAANASTISLTPSLNPAPAGSAVAFTATVSGSNGTPTGSVSFFDGTNDLGSMALNSSGQTTLSSSTLLASGSPHSITAVYSGSSIYAGSASVVLSQVIQNSSTTVLLSSQNPALAGNTVTFTATVSGSSGTPTGTLSFFDGSTNLASETLNSSGQATFSSSALSASGSPHSITAVYSGNSAYLGSTSSVLWQVIQSASATALVSSQNPSSAGGTVTFTATVSGNSGTPTGTLSFFDGSTNLASETLNSSGQAAFSSSALSASGSPHSITAVYSGNSAYVGSTSSVLWQVIQSASATALVSSQNPSSAGSTVTFTATVSGSGGTPTGTLSFFEGSTNLASETLNSSGQAAFSSSTFSASGSPYAITAVYSGNSTYAGSTSGVLSQVVNGAPLLTNSSPPSTGVSVTTLSSSQNPALAGSTVTFTATVSGNGGSAASVPGYLTNGLVEWNKLNDGAGTLATDASGHNNSLPLMGAPSWNSGYLTLNGSTQYADAGSNRLASLDQHDKTICLWINKVGSSQKGLVDKSYNVANVGYGGWGFWVQSNGKLMWTVNDSQAFYDNGIGAVTLGSWTFVTAVWHYSSQRTDFYLNGVLNSSVNNGAAAEFASDSADLEVGNLRNNLSNGAYAFDGAMHDVGIYNRALSAAEVGSNYLSSEFTTNVSTPDLLYYRMTESAQVNPPVFLADSSTHGGTTGTVYSSYAVQWVTNAASIPASAIHFNGVATYIETSNSTLFNFTTNLFTMNIWIRPLTPDGYIAENGVLGTSGWYLRVGGSYQVMFGSETNGTDTFVSTGAGAAQIGMFTMVTIVRTGPTNVLIYINGVPVDTTGSIVNPASSTNSLIFGLDRATAHYYDGDLWMPQVWGEALPSSAVANLYLKQSAGYPWPVVSGGGTPTGSVTFFNGSSSLGSSMLNSAGQASLSTTALSASGSPYAITAVYGGSGTLAGSTSSMLSQIITNASSSTGSASSDITNGLVAWYPLAGNASDYSGNGNNGTPIGNPTYTTGVAGTANTAISLNGSSQYISLGHPSLYNFGTGNFTVSVWFKTTASSLRQQLFSCDAISGRQFVFDLNDFPGAPVVSYLFSGNSTFFAEEGGSALTANAWYLVTFVKSGNEPGAMTMYLNGSPVSSPIPFGVDFPLTMQATSTEVDIGHRTYSGYNDFFSGSLCGVRVYNRALSASEVTTVYNNGISLGIY